MRTVEHRVGGRSTPGSPSGTAPVRDPHTGNPQAEVVLVPERWPAVSALIAASYSSPTSA